MLIFETTIQLCSGLSCLSGRVQMGDIDRWEDIKMDRIEIGSEGMDCIHLEQDKGLWWALVKIVEDLSVP